ncbi:MAG: LysR family transcriptional regulator [Cyanobacteria bacterium P01_F01_bin.116]
MNLSKLKLSQLRALVAIKNCGNFSEAALQLGVNQSTVSHAIATLEDQLGVVLLNRGRHGAKLTPVGKQITDKAIQVLKLVDDMAQDAQQARGLQGGTVRIAAFRSVATHLLPAAIARLHSRYPSIQVTITEDNDIEDLKQLLTHGDVDICVAELLDSNEFETVPIFEDEYVALLPSKFGPRDAQLTYDDLQGHPLISPSKGTCFSRLDNYLKQNRIDLKITYYIRHDSSMVSMVSQGLGIALMPELAAAPVPDGVQIYQLPFAIKRPIGASLLKDGLHSPAVYAFLDVLRETDNFSVPQAV